MCFLNGYPRICKSLTVEVTFCSYLLFVLANNTVVEISRTLENRCRDQIKDKLNGFYYIHIITIL